MDTKDPLIAEALAIKWALELVQMERYPNIIVESDSKVCIEAITGITADSWWKIDALCSDVVTLGLSFSSVCFSWVRREANSLAHELANYAVSLTSLFCCNAYTLPPSVFEAWQRDVLGI